MATRTRGIHFESQAQIERIKLAARLKGTNFNAYVRAVMVSTADADIREQRQRIAELRKQELELQAQ